MASVHAEQNGAPRIDLAEGRKVPGACTTAAAIRREAVEPTMDELAGQRRERELLATIHAATKELAELSRQREERLRRVAGFVDRAAERLDHAERHGSYDEVRIVSEVPSARNVAQRINTAIDTLVADPHNRAARESLHAIFETFGADLFEQRFMYHIGQRRTLTLKGEFDRWQVALPVEVGAA